MFLWIGAIARRISLLVLHTRYERELQEEMRLHQDLRAQALQETGLPEDLARAGAIKRFGGQLRMTEASVDAWGWRWLDEFVRDVRFGARTLIKNPVFTVTSILTLAAAIGATTAIFSVVDSVLLRPLPFAQPDRLVQVYELQPVGGRGAVSLADLQEFKRSPSFEGFTGYGTDTRLLVGRSDRERLNAVVTDSDFFSVLGVQPLAGRTFRAGDPPTSIVISERLWQRRFNRESSTIGSTIELQGSAWDERVRQTVTVRRQFTVLGVMPDRFQFPYGSASTLQSALPESRTDLWIGERAAQAAGRTSVTARMKPGVSLQAAAEELKAIERQLDVTAPGPFRATGVELESLEDLVLKPIKRLLWMLFGSVGLVLAAACANIANLMLAHTTTRMREVATRAALGAGRWRLIRQFLTESILLSALGSFGGALVAMWGSEFLVRLGAAKIPRAHEVVLDWRTFGFLSVVCFGAAVLFGLTPALLAAQTGLHAKASQGRVATVRRYQRVRDALVVTEVTLACVLAVAAALLLREAHRVAHVDTGMQVAHVLTLHLTPTLTNRADYYRLEEAVAQMPGVEAAGFTQLLPLQNWGWVGDFYVLGGVVPPFAQRAKAELRTVTPGYFRALGIPIRAGRSLAEQAGPTNPSEILVNETLVRQQFAGGNAVGRRLNRGLIVGVVADTHQAGLDQLPVAEIYQSMANAFAAASDIGMSLVVRTKGAPRALEDEVRATIRQENASVAIFNVKSLEEIVADSQWELTLYKWLIGLFALLAVALAGIGLYGVIAYNARARETEFAVRLALGSPRGRLAILVVSHGLRLVVGGLVIGLAAVIVLSPSLTTWRAGLSVTPQTLVGISVLLLAVALVASGIPMLRVFRLSPSTALRHD